MSEALEVFVNSLVGAKSHETVTWYRKRLTPLVEFLGDMDVGTVTVHDLRRWRASLVERETRYEDHPTVRPKAGGLSVYTVHGYVRAARHFFKWLEDEGLLAANPARRLELPDLPRGTVKGIDRGDLDKLFAAATSARDRALLWFLYSTGCRVGGVARLRLDCLDLDCHICFGDMEVNCGKARVQEKGNKTRPVFLVPPAVKAMQEWLAVRPEVGHGFVFLNMRRLTPLTPSGIYQILRDLAETAGVTKGFNPHSIRHLRMRELGEWGMPLDLRAQVAGHADPNLTGTVYGWVSEDTLQRVFIQYAWLLLGGNNGDSLSLAPLSFRR